MKKLYLFYLISKIKKNYNRCLILPLIAVDSAYEFTIPVCTTLLVLVSKTTILLSSPVVRTFLNSIIQINNLLIFT